MRSIYRDLDLPVDDSTLTSLDDLTKKDLEDAMRSAGWGGYSTRVINRLHNLQKKRQGKEIKAFYLTGQGFEPMAPIELMFEDHRASGYITNAVDIGNADTIAVTILPVGAYKKETTWLVGREDTVRIWRKERVQGLLNQPPVPDYDKPVTHGFLKASYIAENLSSFFGKVIAVKFQGTGVLTQVEVKAAEPDVFYFTLNKSNVVRLSKDDVVNVYREKPSPGFLRPGPYPWATPSQRTPLQHLQTAYARNSGRTAMQDSVRAFHDTYLMVPDDRPDFRGSAWTLMHNHAYRGKTLQISPKIKGVVTDIQPDNEGKLVFVIDGIMHKRNRTHFVKLWDKKEN